MLQGCIAQLSQRMGKDRWKQGNAVARFLLPGAFLLGGAALRDYPLTATTCATALTSLAIGVDVKNEGKLKFLTTGTGLLLSAIPLSIYRAWNSSGSVCWSYAANGLISSASIALYISLWVKYGHKFNKKVVASELSNLLFPVICYAIQKAVPPSPATVGIGATVLGAIFFSHKWNDKIRLQSIAYGTAFALVPTAVVGAWKSLNWSDRLLYSSGVLLNLTPLILTPFAIYQTVRKKTDDQHLISD